MSSLLGVLFLLTFLTKSNSLVLDVQAENGVDELATGDTAKYLLITTVTEPTELKFQIKLPFNSTSLFTVVHMTISSAGSNLVLQQPLPKFLLKEVYTDTGNSRAEWSLGQVTRSNSQISNPSDDNLIIRVTIQVQDHPLLFSDSIHWLNFTLLYASDSQYLVQKPVTIRGGLNRLVSLNLEMNSSFEGVYAVGQVLSFDMQVSHHHESTAASKDLKLFLYSQPYMKLLTVKERGVLKYIDELNNAAGVVTMKISPLELFQTLSLSVSMSIGSFKNKDANGNSITHSLISELVYKKISVEQCQQEIQNTAYEVKTLDYHIQLQLVNKSKVNLEEKPLITFLKPLIKCSSCGFRNCCALSNVHINSSSYWVPFPVEDKLQFLEFDFYTFVLLKSISIKGSGNEGNAYVKTFKLLFSNDGIRWSTQIYRGKKQIYDGNVNSNDNVVQSIKPVTNARFVRIVPLSWYKRAALRVEFWSDQIEAFQMLGTKENRCIGSNGQDNGVYLVACDMNLQQWVWTDNEQLRHLKTGKCLHGHFAASTYSNAVSLEVCNSSLVTQKWHCYEDYVVASKTGSKSLSQLTNHAVRMSPLNGSNVNDKIIKIYSNKKSICSEKGMPALAKRQMLWQKQSDTLFVCDLNSRSEITVSHCHFTDDRGATWQDLDLQLFNLLGVQIESAHLYGSLFGQKTVLKMYYYAFVLVKRILKSEWETINNSSSTHYPVNIPFIPFGDNAPDSEQPTDALTISSEGIPQWGASSAGIHSYVDNKWNLVLSWSKLGTRYARPGSCKQILEFGLSNGDGNYTIYPGHPLVGVKAYCDMTRNGGGWTLLLTSKTAGWTLSQLLSYATDMPSISTDHSILNVSNEIRDQTKEDCLQYRLEAQQFGRYGGIWRAPKSYSFLAINNSQVNVELVEKFGSWDYRDSGIEKRMPWICTNERCNALLTTSEKSNDRFFGTIVCTINQVLNTRFIPAPWIGIEIVSPGIIWYWMREGGCAYN